MPNFNTAPYFDDFDPEKGFYQVLFKPGYAVQARELNQLQSILQHQISTVGNHLFKKNTVVIPGGIALHNYADIISVTGIDDPSTLVNKTITNCPTPDVNDFASIEDYIIATVVAVREATQTQPAALYIQYKNPQADGERTFEPVRDNGSGGLFTVDAEDDIINFQLHATLGATVGKVATLAEGMFFTKDRFVLAPNQSVIIEVDNTIVTNCVVGLTVEESFVTAYDDESLLDNAAGFPNHYAPGADRYKISLTLGRFDENVPVGDNFIRMMDIENDTITYLNDNTQYAELMKTLARRTFDANGNFVVAGLNPSITKASDDNYVVANITKGRCYVGGYEYNQIADRPFNIDKPRDQVDANLNPIYQQTVEAVSQIPPEQVYFFVADDAQAHCQPGNVVQFTGISYNTDVLWLETPIIGMGIFRSVEYYRPGVYRMFIDSLSLEKGVELADIGGIRFLNTPDVGYNAGTSVLHELTIANVNGIFDEGDIMTGSGETSTLAAAAFNAFELSTVAISGTGGQFTCSADALKVGELLTISGTFGGTGSIAGYTNPTTYKVSAVTGTVGAVTAFTLTTVAGAAITTTAGTPTGLTYSADKMKLYAGSTAFDPDGYDRELRGWRVSGTGIGAGTYVKSADATTIYLTQEVTGAVTSVTLTNEQLGTIYYVVGDKVYLRKDTFSPIPYNDLVRSYAVGDTATIIATADRVSGFVTNYTPSVVPFIPIENQPILEVEPLEYQIVRAYQFTITEAALGTTYTMSSESDGYPLTNPDVFKGRSAKYAWVYLPEDDIFLRPTATNGITLTIEDFSTNENNDFSIALDDSTNGFDYFPGVGQTKTLVVYMTIERHNTSAVTKNNTEVVVNIPNPSDSWMALGYQDVISVDRIVDGKVVNVTDASWAANVATVELSYTVASPYTAYNHTAGDIVVVRGVKSDADAASTAGDYYKTTVFGGFAGYNGKHELLTVSAPSFSAVDGDGLKTVTVTVTYAVVGDAGTFIASDGTMALEPDINNDTIVTDRYRWDSGNTAYYTGTGTIKLIRGSGRPNGQLGVRLFYYDIPVEDENDYVAVNSYAGGAVDLSYIGEIPDIKDAAGNVIKVRSSLDYRPRFSRLVLKNIATTVADSNVVTLKDINLSVFEEELIDTFIVGPAYGQASVADCPARIGKIGFNPETGNTELFMYLPLTDTNFPASFDSSGTYFIGLKWVDGSADSGIDHQFSVIDPDNGGRFFTYPRTKSRLKYDYVKFLPRKTMLYVDRDKDVLTVQTEDVENLDALKSYVRSDSKLPLAYLHFQPYTLSVSDVKVTKFSMPVYQMVDIDQIEQRVDALEYNVLLEHGSESEGGYDTSDNGATRGYWSEDFSNYQNHDYESSDFSCTVYDREFVGPETMTRTVNMDLVLGAASETWKRTGSSVSLPYKESKAIRNTAASSSSNLNPYNQIQWEGKMMLYPSVDNWIDVSGNPPPVVDDGAGSGVQVPFPPTPGHPPIVIPPTPSKEIITEINIIKAAWGPDSDGGKHAITFEWKTSTGRTGRVNTDTHLSSAIKEKGKAGYNGEFALSLLNTKFLKSGTKAYLNAGRHFDQKPPQEW